MIARLIQMQAPTGEQFDQVMSVVAERVVPAVRQLPGFRADYFAGDSASGRLVSFVLWENEAGVAAAEDLFQRMGPQIASLGLTFEAVENLPILVGG